MSNTNEPFDLGSISTEMLGNLDVTNSVEKVEPVKPIEPSVSVATELKSLETIKNKKDSISRQNPKYMDYLNEDIQENYIMGLASSELVNIPFFGELRAALYHPVKAQIMDAFNIRSSYTGFYQFYDGKRPMLPHTGLMKIAEALDYSIYQIPVRNDSGEDVLELLEKLQGDFVGAVRNKIITELPVEQKRSKSTKSTKKTKPSETNDIMVGFINNHTSSSMGSMLSEEINGLDAIDTTSVEPELDHTLSSGLEGLEVADIGDIGNVAGFNPLDEVVEIDTDFAADENSINEENESFEPDTDPAFDPEKLG